MGSPRTLSEEVLPQSIEERVCTKKIFLCMAVFSYPLSRPGLGLLPDLDPDDDQDRQDEAGSLGHGPQIVARLCDRPGHCGRDPSQDQEGCHVGPVGRVVWACNLVELLEPVLEGFIVEVLSGGGTGKSEAAKLKRSWFWAVRVWTIPERDRMSMREFAFLIRMAFPLFCPLQFSLKE